MKTETMRSEEEIRKRRSHYESIIRKTKDNDTHNLARDLINELNWVLGSD